MGAREFGRKTARRWTGWIAAAGIALTGVVGVGTYHALESAATSSAASTATSTSDDSGTAPSSDDSGSASSSSGLSAGSGTSQTGSSGS